MTTRFDSGTWLPITSRQDSTWLQDALAIGTVLALQWGARSGMSQRSANAAEILGFGSDQVLTAERFLAQVDPEDRKLRIFSYLHQRAVHHFYLGI